MGTYFHFLQKMYNDILADALLAKDSYSCATLLNPSVFSSAKNHELSACNFSAELDAQISSGLDPINDSQEVSKNFSHLKCHAHEIMLLQLTLIKMMLAKLQLQEVATGIKQKYLEILRILEEANIVSELIYLLRSSEKQLSHVASKSLVSLVHFQLTKDNSLNSAWLAFCLETLSGFPSNSWIAECLWTLTNIIKEILKDDDTCKEGDLKKLLTPLDTVLESFYSSILSYYSSVPQDVPLFAKSTNDLNGFLDLFELLVASRIQMPLNLGCQRILFLNSYGICCLTTSPVHDLIKKKSIMLLKKCILHKAGEDLIKIKVLPSSHQDPHLDNDRLTLADTVLQFVNSGWLDRLSTSGNISHFDGSKIEPQVHINSNFDPVTFRSLSLLLLKAFEMKIQDFAYKAEPQVHLENVMCVLLAFLKSHLRSSASICSFEHPCMWISLFIEQDDEMVEAAKSLLAIYLNLERLWHDVNFTLCHLDEGTQDTWTHQNGCNPHCIFLFLLRSIAFDATVLLDFLISSETCFLEYFVQYLKLLVEDWHQFVKVSKCFKFTVGKDLRIWGESLSCQQKDVCKSDLTMQSTSYDTQTCTEALLTSSLNLSTLWPRDSQAIQPNRSDFLTASNNPPFQKLVDYDSSEDSEVECVREECLTEIEQVTLNNQTCKSEAVLNDDNAETSKQNVLPLIQQDLNISSSSCCKIPPNKFELTDEIFQKATVCFQQLQKSISRLHARNLFPYNPNALLRLLNQVNIINKDHRSA
ncbi:protein Lines homolog 1 [Python bivittatus]|uniref:Protein Lines homolog 1 n=1 Tax=Python bivittatus TaxID=176946 RepID=A0A9F5IHC9_PYTBI|nr:protein Lines homolog 1 [Python bivittatus]XP_025020445.1 protein Lines homolog 1 [Python bivittatus]XP_025020446.1 protein Lines homolog 1 [Python bivittatus]